MRIGTLNFSHAACLKHPAQVAAAIETAFVDLQVDALAGQEAGSAGAILAGLQRDDVCQVVRPDGPAGATPVLVRPGLRISRRWTLPILPRTFVGIPGAGASPFIKAKSLVLAGWHDPETEREIVAGSFHGVASAMLNPLRRRAATRLVAKVAGHVDRVEHAGDPVIRGCLFVGADTNYKAGDRHLTPLRAAGLVSAQTVRGPVGTHGSRAIDDVFHRDRSIVRLDTIEVHSTVSDHDLFVADYSIRHRRR